MMRVACLTVVLLALVLPIGAPAVASPTAPRVATPASPSTVEELRALVEDARRRFVARDTGGVLAYLADNYRSGGLTKPDIRQHLTTLYALYDAVRAQVRVDRVDVVDGDAWVYTTGQVTGRLPMIGWVTVLSWQGEPEVARRLGDAWRLVGFQD
jgi:hypothetical protein